MTFNISDRSRIEIERGINKPLSVLKWVERGLVGVGKNVLDGEADI